MTLQVTPEAFQNPESISISVLLIDDQVIISEAVKRMLEDDPDIVLHYCSDPSLAIQTADEVHPTVILQDLVMPEIDGLMLVRYFRAHPSTSNVPLIVLSTKEDPMIKAEAFELGANDYIVKLPDKAELVARIRYHSAAYISLMERNKAYQMLQESQKLLKQELADAAQYVRSLLPQPVTGAVYANSRFVPSTTLGGDAYGYYWMDDDHFAFYLLDVCGHGVGAALLSISVMNVLRSQTLANTDFYDPSSVLKSLNESFQMENHNNMFFTIWYGIYNKTERKITYSSGGHPPAILFNGKFDGKGEPQELQTQGLVIGGMPGIKFEKAIIEVKPGSRLYVYSDGVYEITKDDGSMVSLNEFVQVLSMPDVAGQDPLERIQEYTQKINGPGAYDDDYSIMEIVFD